MKKLVALVLALVMVLSLCTVAFADMTIGDLLGNDFPKKATDGWISEDYRAFVDEVKGILLIVSSDGEELANVPLGIDAVKKPSGTYWDGKTWIDLTMENGKLKNIIWTDSRDKTFQQYEFTPQEDTGDTTDCDFNLLPLIGLYWTAKTIGSMVKTAVTMPYIAHAMKLAVPTAVAALCLKAVSHAVWHLR